MKHHSNSNLWSVGTKLTQNNHSWVLILMLHLQLIISSNNSNLTLAYQMMAMRLNNNLSLNKKTKKEANSILWLKSSSWTDKNALKQKLKSKDSNLSHMLRIGNFRKTESMKSIPSSWLNGVVIGPGLNPNCRGKYNPSKHSPAYPKQNKRYLH